jgi:hypothetical protein
MHKLVAGTLVAAALVSQSGRADAAGPLTFDVKPCSVTLSGTGYDELTIYRTDEFGTHYQLAAPYQGDTVTVDYGAWLVAEGETATFTAVAQIDNVDVATAGPHAVGPCQTGASVEIDVVDAGTPPTPADGIYRVFVGMCAIGKTPASWSLAAGDPPLVVPVPAGIEFCPTASKTGTAEPLTLDAEENRFTVAAGGTAEVEVTVEWAAEEVVLRHAGGVNPGLPSETTYAWAATGGGVDPADGDCEIISDGTISCGYDRPRLRQGGTLELTMAGAPGWALATTSFDAGDCSPVPFEGSTICGLDVAYIAPGGSVPSSGPCPSNPNPFIDLAANGVHTGNVVCAAGLGLVKGGPGGAPADVFGPLGTTTRAQLASLVRNLLQAGGVPAPAFPPDAFGDDDGDTHESSINALTALGVIGGNGGSGNQFFPNRPATRGEIASFLHRAYAHIAGSPMAPGADVFGDDESHPAEDAINALAAAGVIVGKGPGVFDPDATVTREQIATMLVGLVHVLVGAGAW